MTLTIIFSAGADKLNAPHYHLQFSHKLQKYAYM